MINHTDSSYEAAIVALNSLQSNASVVAMIKQQRQLYPIKNIHETVRYLEESGVQIKELDRLNVIHIAGTKGKGSTAAFVESILRNRGYKTGFYSGPHLVHVRERIRLNGRPIGETEFANYFWKLYHKLRIATRPKTAVEELFPLGYFKFLTLLAYRVFLAEKVDVAIMEVGIGGAYDCTNIIRNPVVTAVTTLDIDHVAMLGSTLAEIAWQKAGIFKPGAVAVTIPQDQEAMPVLCRRARELKAPLYVAPDISHYIWHRPYVKVGIPGSHQSVNVTLAMQIAHLWMKRMKNNDRLLSPESTRVMEILGEDIDGAYSYRLPILDGFPVTKTDMKSLKFCKWPGRCQTVKMGRFTYYLDGAHTSKSMQSCADWFQSESDIELDQQIALGSGVEAKILIFHCTADRPAEHLLTNLLDFAFTHVLFCPPIAESLRAAEDLRSDQTNVSQTPQRQLGKVEINRQTWLQLRADNSHMTTSPPGMGETTLAFTCIKAAFEWIDANVPSTTAASPPVVQILVTGSLHLVGGAIRLIDPTLAD